MGTGGSEADTETDGTGTGRLGRTLLSRLLAGDVIGPIGRAGEVADGEGTGAAPGCGEGTGPGARFGRRPADPDACPARAAAWPEWGGALARAGARALSPCGVRPASAMTVPPAVVAVTTAAPTARAMTELSGVMLDAAEWTSRDTPSATATTARLACRAAMTGKTSRPGNRRASTSRTASRRVALSSPARTMIVPPSADAKALIPSGRSLVCTSRMSTGDRSEGCRAYRRVGGVVIPPPLLQICHPSRRSGSPLMTRSNGEGRGAVTPPF